MEKELLLKRLFEIKEEMGCLKKELDEISCQLLLYYKDVKNI